MGKETEYKLEVGDLQLLDCILCSEPIASRMQAPFAYIRMQTTYYDTEDGLLEKNRWMLRLRTENERSVVTMKTPGEGHTRGEWEVESAYLDEALPKLYEDLSFGYVLSRSYSSSGIRCSVRGWADPEDHRTANLYLGAYDADVRSAWLDYLVDGKSAAQSVLKFAEADDEERSVVQWWISDIPDESTAGVYSIYGAEGVEFGLPYGAELQVVFHAELTDGTRLSAMLTREIMPSANNSADGESETTAMPIILTKD